MNVQFPFRYLGWSNCCRISNQQVELIVTCDVGPRIIHYGFIGEMNLFAVDPMTVGQVGGDEWRVYGGHRLWHAPEVRPRTYFADNRPVQRTQTKSSVTFRPPAEESTGIQKEITIALDPDSTEVTVAHRLTNCSQWPIELAPWALSVMAAGGVGIVPLPAAGSHGENLLPTNSLSLWAYSDLSDPRWSIGSGSILLRQDAAASTPQKIGVNATLGWLAYAREGYLFVKAFDSEPNSVYPDRNATTEMFTDSFMLELETLGPLVTLAPEQSVTHTERWFAAQEVAAPTSCRDVDERIKPLVAELMATGR